MAMLYFVYIFLLVLTIMNSLKDLSRALESGRKDLSDVALAKRTGLTRQSIAHAFSGTKGFNVTTLLAIAEANDQVVMIVPKEVARAISTSPLPKPKSVSTMTEHLKDL